MAIIRLHAALFAAGAALLLPGPQALAHVAGIAWSTAGKFERSLSIAPGQFAEVRGAVAGSLSEAVAWAAAGRA